MTEPRNKPIKDANGVMHPELDHRDVPLSVMAAYMGVHPNTVYVQIQDGSFPAEAKVMHGSRTYYRPWVWVKAREAARA
jgi:hypothetical protein